MKIYLDTSILAVLLFGGYSASDKKRKSVVAKVCEIIEKRNFRAVISIYVLQEIYSLAKALCQPDELETFSWMTFRELFRFNFGLLGLLPRDKRLLFRNKFPIQDSTDEPHVISA